MNAKLIKWLEKQIEALSMTNVLVCKGKCDHGYMDEFGNELFCSIKEKTEK